MYNFDTISGYYDCIIDSIDSIFPFLFIFAVLIGLFLSILSCALEKSNDTKESNNDYGDFTKRCESDLNYYGITPKKEEKLSFYQKLKRKYSKEDF